MKYLALFGALLFACCRPLPLQAQADPSSISSVQSQDKCPQERVYAALLSTRIHRLSGENPIVGVFDTNDGGVTWGHSGWPQGRHFAVVTEPGSCGAIRYVAAGNGLFRTTDNGATWRITTDWQQTEIQDAAVSTTDPNIILAATPYGIFRSTNRGDTWIDASSGLSQRFVSSIRFDRTNGELAFAGTESGVYVSNDGGITWSSSMLKDPVRSVRQSPGNPKIWVAGLQQKGAAVSRDSGVTWELSAGLDGATIYEVEFGINDGELWAGGWDVGVWYSPDLGRTWEQRSSGIAYLSIHALAISRANPGKIWAGSMGGGLYVSHDNGITWQTANTELFDAGQIWDLYIDSEQ